MTEGIIVSKTLVKYSILSLWLLMTILPLPARAQRPIEENNDQIQSGQDLSLADLGYETITISHKQQSKSKTFILNLPSNFAIKETGNYLELVIGHAPPIPDKLSTISARFNNVPLDIIVLDETNAEPTPYRFDLTNTPPIVGRNELKIYLDVGDICEGGGARVDAVIYNTSYFHLAYDPIEYTPDLALYPTPFYENSYQSNEVFFILPDHLSATDLSAAATIAAGLGKFSAGQVKLAVALDSQLTNEIRTQHHLILIGQERENCLLSPSNLPLIQETPDLSETQGVIHELVSPWNRFKMILVVTGSSNKGILKASQALNRELRFPGMRGPIAVVEAVTPPPDDESQIQDIDMTLESLGYRDDTVYGVAPQEQRYGFWMPPAWNLIEEPQLVLSFRHSEIVDPELSSLSVYLNKTPVGSVLLNAENAYDGLLEAPLPSWKLQSGRNEIKVSIEMNIRGAKGDKCFKLGSDDQVWTTIYKNSYIHLPIHPQKVQPDLAFFPYPFTQWPNLDDLILVLPDNPQAQDLTAMLRLAAMFGSTTQGNYLTVQAMTASELSEADRQDKNLVVFGQPGENPLIQELNEWLPQPFDKDTNTLQPAIDSVVLVQDPERSVGLIQELPLPWNAERTGLILTGTTGQGVALAYETLLSRSNELSGNIAATESLTGTIHTSFRQAGPADATTEEEEQKVEGVGLNTEHLVQLAEQWW